MNTTSPHIWTCFTLLRLRTEVWLGWTGPLEGLILHSMAKKTSLQNSFRQLEITGPSAHTTTNLARTATSLPGSSLQVHWNLYSTSVHQWWNFEPFASLNWTGSDDGLYNFDSRNILASSVFGLELALRRARLVLYCCKWSWWKLICSFLLFPGFIAEFIEIVR